MLEPTDYTQLWNDMRENISLVSGGKPTPGQGTFGHIAGGYDAGAFGSAILINDEADWPPIGYYGSVWCSMNGIDAC